MVNRSLTAFDPLRQVNGHESSAFYVVFLLLLTKFCGANPSVGSRAIWTSEGPNKAPQLFHPPSFLLVMLLSQYFNNRILQCISLLSQSDPCNIIVVEVYNTLQARHQNPENWFCCCWCITCSSVGVGLMLCAPLKFLLRDPMHAMISHVHFFLPMNLKTWLEITVVFAFEEMWILLGRTGSPEVAESSKTAVVLPNGEETPRCLPSGQDSAHLMQRLLPQVVGLQLEQHTYMRKESWDVTLVLLLVNLVRPLSWMTGHFQIMQMHLFYSLLYYTLKTVWKVCASA
jgi:hypothetical protein